MCFSYWQWLATAREAQLLTTLKIIVWLAPPLCMAIDSQIAAICVCVCVLVKIQIITVTHLNIGRGVPPSIEIVPSKNTNIKPHRWTPLDMSLSQHSYCSRTRFSNALDEILRETWYRYVLFLQRRWPCLSALFAAQNLPFTGCFRYGDMSHL